MFIFHATVLTVKITTADGRVWNYPNAGVMGKELLYVVCVKVVVVYEICQDYFSSEQRCTIIIGHRWNLGK
jgi:hypothetical protein